jgi:hypothetical protein
VDSVERMLRGLLRYTADAVMLQLMSGARLPAACSHCAARVCVCVWGGGGGVGWGAMRETGAPSVGGKESAACRAS